MGSCEGSPACIKDFRREDLPVLDDEFLEEILGVNEDVAGRGDIDIDYDMVDWDMLDRMLNDQPEPELEIPAPAPAVNRNGPAAVNPVEPEVNHAEPEVNHAEPEVNHAEPEVNHEELEVSHAEPEVNHAEPKVNHAEPEVNHAEPEANLAEVAPSSVEPVVNQAGSVVDNSAVPAISSAQPECNGTERLAKNQTRSLNYSPLPPKPLMQQEIPLMLQTKPPLFHGRPSICQGESSVFHFKKSTKYQGACQISQARPPMYQNQPATIQNSQSVFQNGSAMTQYGPATMQNRSAMFQNGSALMQNKRSMFQARPVMFHNKAQVVFQNGYRNGPTMFPNRPVMSYNGSPKFQNLANIPAMTQSNPAMNPMEQQVVGPQNNPVVALNAPNEANAMDVDDDDDDDYGPMPLLSPQVPFPPSSNSSLSDNDEDDEEMTDEEEVMEEEDDTDDELDFSRLSVRTPSPEYIQSAPLPASPEITPVGKISEKLPESKLEIPVITLDETPIFTFSEIPVITLDSSTDEEVNSNQMDHSNAQMPAATSASNQNEVPEPQPGCSRYLYSEPEKKRLKMQMSPERDSGESNPIFSYDSAESRGPSYKIEQGRSSKRLNAILNRRKYLDEKKKGSTHGMLLRAKEPKHYDENVDGFLSSDSSDDEC